MGIRTEAQIARRLATLEREKSESDHYEADCFYEDKINELRWVLRIKGG